MALRIGFDLDGVLADMESALDFQAERLFGRRSLRPVAEETEAVGDLPFVKLPLSARQQNRLWRHVEQIEAFWEILQETEPGMVARLGKLATERRWEVIFLTKRPDSAGATAQVQSQRWLQARGFTLPSVFVVQGSRGRIAAALDLDIVVDDRPENCLDVVVESNARALLVWREDEQLLPASVERLGIRVVKSIDEGLDILTEIDQPSLARQGVVDRVKNLIRRRPRPMTSS